MKNVLYTKFNSFGDILNKVVSGINVNEIEKKNNLSEQWQKLVGEKFKDRTEAVFINQKGILVVACENSAVCSEMYILKQNLEKRLKNADININDIIFSKKLWKKK